MILQGTSKFVIVSVRLLKGKFGGFTGPRRESAVRLESDFHLSLKV